MAKSTFFFKVKAFFSAPVYPDDLDRTISASMVHHGIIFGLVANTLSIPAVILAGDPSQRILATSVPMIFTLLLNLVFLRQGYVRGAGAIFLSLAWVALALINYTAGGVKAPGFSIHIVFVICVGFIFGKRWAFLAAALSTALGAYFVSLENRGLLPPPQVDNTPGRYWLIYASNFFVIAAILTMMVNQLRKAITEGRQELLVRREAERNLARHQISLEETVRERTASLTETNVALLREVQERRLVEEALRREKDFIAQLMETSPVGVMVIDPEGNFTFANAAAALILGRPREEITRLNCASAVWGFTNHEGVRLAPGELPFLPGTASGAKVRNFALAIAAPEGRRTLLSVNTDHLGEHASEPSGYVVTVEDITERSRLEQEFFRAQKLESVGVLAGGIAHDFNNLLTSIMGNVSLALTQLPAEGTIAETLADAEKAALQARELTKQLLTFSRGGRPIKQTLALGALIMDAAQLTLRGSTVRPEFSIPADLWAVEADQGQLTQVFHNLIINAAQSMPHGGTVRLAASNFVNGGEVGIPLPPGNYVKVEVADHGVGIPPNSLMKIFDPFFSTKTGGTGLGLAVVYSVVDKHGGHIDVASAIGTGTTFSLLLPASAAAALPIPPPTGLHHGHGRILLMDDEPVVRQVVSRILTTLGYEVQTAADGSAAVTLFRDGLAGGKPFDAVILDLTVPGGMGGTETIGLLRAIDPGVKAIVSSGYSNNPVLSHYSDHGFDNMIAKPFQAGDLSCILRQVLTEARESSACEP